MHVDDVAGIVDPYLPLATSRGAIHLKRRGFKMRVDDVAGNICVFLSTNLRAFQF